MTSIERKDMHLWMARVLDSKAKLKVVNAPRRAGKTALIKHLIEQNQNTWG